jgi:hypothetical protein
MHKPRIALTTLAALALTAPAGFASAAPTGPPAPAGSASAGSVSAGSVSAGSVSAGSVSAGSVSAGSVSAGSVSAGSVSAGSASARSAPSPSCAPPDAPLLGITRIDGRRTLARFALRTLRPRRAPRVRVPLRVDVAGAAFSPGCDAVALPVRHGRILVVDLERGRRSGSLTLAGRSAIGPLAWTRPDRLTGFVGPHSSQRVVTVSVPDGRLVGAHRVGGRPWVSEATSLGMAIVAGPADRIGPATLALATPDGGMLRAPLARIRAGYEDRGPNAPAPEVIPGLAVDEASATAYVVGAREPLVAEVDLTTGAVRYRRVRPGAGTAAGPVALAADRIQSGPYRVARWLGDGTIAVSGGSIRPEPDHGRRASEGRPATRVDPYGLQLIQTAGWSVTTLDPLLFQFTLAADALVGMRWVGDRLAVYRAGSDRSVRIRGSRPRGPVSAAWPYAYVTVKPPRLTHVVDLRTGRTVNTIPSVRPPSLLIR